MRFQRLPRYQMADRASGADADLERVHVLTVSWSPTTRSGSWAVHQTVSDPALEAARRCCAATALPVQHHRRIDRRCRSALTERLR